MTNVLLFHGVTEQPKAQSPIQNYNRKHICKDRFTELLLGLRSGFNFYSIDQFFDAWASGEPLPNNSCVVTFDDGFLNNYEIASPILEDLGIPAVFYVSTGNISYGDLFWVDQLEIAFIKAYRYGIKLCLGGSNSEAANSVDTQSLSLDSIILCLDKLKSRLKLVHPEERDSFIEYVASQVKHIDAGIRMKDYETMSWEHVRRLDSSPLFTIGGHSVHHNIFATMSDLEQEAEIRDSIHTLRQELGDFSGHYSYPEGQPEHFTSSTIECLKQHGVKCCPSAINGVAHIETQSLFDFHRLMLGIDTQADRYLDSLLLRIKPSGPS